MQTAIPEVYTALQSICSNVDYFFPQETRAIPSISYQEAENREVSRTVDGEVLSELVYAIDLWNDTPESNITLSELVDGVMVGLGFKRTFAADLYESDTRVHHKSMRYRGVLHIGQQKIYQ